MTSGKTKAAKASSPGRWPLTVAKSRLSEIIRKTRDEGPQIITSHGEDVVELRLVPKRRASYVPTGTGYDFFLASIPYRAKSKDDEIEFDTSFEVTDRPIDLP